MSRTTFEQALSMEAPRPTTSVPPTKLGKQPLPPLAGTPLQESNLLHNFLTLCTDFALIYSIFYLSLLWCETEKATSMALFVCAPRGKLTETFIMLLCIEHFLTNQINQLWSSLGGTIIINSRMCTHAHTHTHTCTTHMCTPTHIHHTHVCTHTHRYLWRTRSTDEINFCQNKYYGDTHAMYIIMTFNPCTMTLYSYANKDQYYSTSIINRWGI